MSMLNHLLKIMYSVNREKREERCLSLTLIASMQRIFIIFRILHAAVLIFSEWFSLYGAFLTYWVQMPEVVANKFTGNQLFASFFLEYSTDRSCSSELRYLLPYRQHVWLAAWPIGYASITSLVTTISWSITSFIRNNIQSVASFLFGRVIFVYI